MNRSCLSIGAVILLGCSGEGADVQQSTSAQTEAHATITFGSDWSELASGPLLAGGKATIVYDTERMQTCTGSTQGGIPQWAITGYYELGGVEESFDVFSPNNPEGDAPTIDLPKAGRLAIWFQATNRWGCLDWDSDFGNNYRFDVAQPATHPHWVGNATSVVSRHTCGVGPCGSDFRQLADGATFGTWARQRASISNIYFEAWEPGVTDRDNPDLWIDLDVQMHVRFDASEPFDTEYVYFERRTDHNARYAVSLRDLDPLRGNTITQPEDCPDVPLALDQSGAYVVTEAELYFTVNEVELRPAEGETYRVRFEDYAGLYEVCLP
jgi:hypothetical protein